MNKWAGTTIAVSSALGALFLGYLAWAEFDARKAANAAEVQAMEKLREDIEVERRAQLRKDLSHCRDYVDRNALYQLNESQKEQMSYCATVVRAFEPENPILNKVPSGM